MWGEKNKEISLVQQEFKYFDSVCVCFTANQTKLYLTCSNIWTRYLSRSGMVRGGKPARVCHLWILSKPRRGFLTTFHRSAQSAALDDEDWAPMAPSCSRDAAKTLTFLLLFPEDPVQEAPLMFCLPVKRSPPRLGLQSPQYLSRSSLFSFEYHILSRDAAAHTLNNANIENFPFPLTFLRN